MFKQDRFNQKEFLIYFTLYNLTVFAAWIFLIAFNFNVELSKIFENYEVFRYANITKGMELLMRNFHFVWWIPITLYFNFQITKRRLSDIGYSKWWGLFNFYPLVAVYMAMYELLFSIGVNNTSIINLIFYVILPIIKIILIILLLLHPTKPQGNQNV
ncbi:DUF805 domain-containing protein [Muribacter muris]|uniref:DUF805 domain-containing protein n=1 Tax=Muribacter muris TaxID=67855 RepID=A0A4Y9K4N8_9PAST|nr:DUF805 domain-containing protein [Muribacter muris]MBF0784285.1 DUF805 domain-containing protein [Muribacter muris]MBF0826977.1 DUF805 domain-containing protein [Muribacter muris]TFV13024.1 DUF805 domain-containing protein [Muribacter muris]